MGNKYSSNVRTYTARNLVWTLSATGAYTPVLMAAPVDVTLAKGDYFNTGNLCKQMVQCQWPTETDWNRESKISIKRFGVFSNFADGLVFEQNNSRMALYLTATSYNIITFSAIGSKMSVSAGENYLKNVVDTTGFLSYGSLVVCGNPPATRYPYFIGTAYSAGARIPLSDYSEVTAVDSPLRKLHAAVSLGTVASQAVMLALTGYTGDWCYRSDLNAYFVITCSTDNGYLPILLTDWTQQTAAPVSQTKTYDVKVIDTLNVMYESEAFMGIVPASSSHFVFLSAYLDIAGSPLQLYTKTIDPSFNGLPVSFDVSVEIEVTPQ